MAGAHVTVLGAGALGSVYAAWAAEAATQIGCGCDSAASSRATRAASSGSRAQIPAGAQRINAPLDWLERLAARRMAAAGAFAPATGTDIAWRVVPPMSNGLEAYHPA